MGAPWRIVVHARSESHAREAVAAGFAEVERLTAILSDYDPESELSRLSAAAPTAEPVVVGEDLWRVLVRAVEFRDRSAGAFDPTVGPLTTLWRRARRSGVMPPPGSVSTALAAVGADALVLHPERRAVSLPKPGTRLDLGGIGMGYAVDRAMDVIRAAGIEAALIDASGDIRVSAAPPGQTAWRIDVAGLARIPPRPAGGGSGTRETLLLVDAAVTTSGDAHQGVEIGGVRYSHVIDPRSGSGVKGPAAVTVVACDCTTADALATAASVLGPAQGAEVVAGVAGAAARFVWWEDGEVREAAGPRWPPQSSHSPRSHRRP